MPDARSSRMSHGLQLLDIDFINKRLREPPAKKSRLESYFLGVMEFAEAPPSPTLSDSSSTLQFDSHPHEMYRKSQPQLHSPATSNSPSHPFRVQSRSAPLPRSQIRRPISRKEPKMRSGKGIDPRRLSQARKINKSRSGSNAHPCHKMETRSRSRAEARPWRRIQPVRSWEKD